MIPPVTLVMELLNASEGWTRQTLGILSNIFYVFDLILWFKHGQGGIYLPILSLGTETHLLWVSYRLWFCMCGNTCLRKLTFTCFPANLLAFLMCYKEKNQKQNNPHPPNILQCLCQ